jgi:hypothetical protein
VPLENFRSLFAEILEDADACRGRYLGPSHYHGVVDGILAKAHANGDRIGSFFGGADRRETHVPAGMTAAELARLLDAGKRHRTDMADILKSVNAMNAATAPMVAKARAEAAKRDRAALKARLQGQLAALNGRANAACAAGNVTGEQGARLDAAIHQLARKIEAI